MVECKGGMSMTTETPAVSEPQVPSEGARIMSRGEKIGRWLIIIATVILTIFLVYVLLVVIFPSMNIGMNP